MTRVIGSRLLSTVLVLFGVSLIVLDVVTNRQAILDVLRTLPGPKLVVWGRRIHHGFFGALLVPLGLLLMLHDWRDRSDWFAGRWR